MVCQKREATAVVAAAALGCSTREDALVDGVISYLNTDLDLTSADDLTALAASFDDAGVRPLHVTQGEDWLWYARFETDKQHAEPEPNIAVMLAVVELLALPLRLVWSG